jgi:Ty3 transposon capsid-like protein/Zinc knuckle
MRPCIATPCSVLTLVELPFVCAVRSYTRNRPVPSLPRESVASPSHSGFGSSVRIVIRDLVVIVAAMEQPQPSPQHSPLHSPAASSGLAPPPMDLAAALAHNAQMQSAGAALQQRVVQLEAEKAALQQRAAATVPTQGFGPRSSRPKGPTPPEFHGLKIGGFEIDAWIRDMKVQFEFYGPHEFPDDASKVRHASMFLKGRAAEWWEAEDKSTGIASNWNLFVNRLHERYRPMQAATVARERLDRLRQKGSVSAYADAFQKELTPIKDMAVSDQIFHFVKGLSSLAVANKVREKEPSSLHAAMDIAVRAEAFLAIGRYGHTGQYFGPSRSAFASVDQGASSTAVPMDVNAVEEEEQGSEDQQEWIADSRRAMGATTSAVDLPAALMAKVEAMVEHRLAAMLQASNLKGSGAALGGRSGGAGGSGRGNGRVPGLSAADVDRLRAENRCFRCKEKGHMKRDCPKSSFQ